MRFWSALRLRCPRCHRGKVFCSLWKTEDRCRVCGLPFSRGPGFFVGAMYFSYGLGILLALPTAIVLVLRQLAPAWIGLIVAMQLAICSPLLVRYSKIVWLYFDEWFDPQ
ncbi:MAG: DUF983 domain-containing protein [Pirellulales bacterium]